MFEFYFKFGRCQRLQPTSPLTPVVQKDSRSHSPTAPIQNSEAPSSKQPNHKFQIRLIAYLSTSTLSTLSTSQHQLKQLILKCSCSLGESGSIGGRGMAKAIQCDEPMKGRKRTEEFRHSAFQNVSRTLWKEKTYALHFE